jgi:hypothetical protein
MDLDLDLDNGVGSGANEILPPAPLAADADGLTMIG